MPHCCIGADVITGFPGESEKSFMETYRFLNALDISYLHVFTYSERDNTEATQLEHAVPRQIRHERNRMLRILSEKKQHAFYTAHLGEIKDVLFESRFMEGMSEGYTDNYIRVKAPSDQTLHGKILPAILTRTDHDYVVAQINDHTREANAHLDALPMQMFS